jgi:hypothetical protein
VKVSQEADYAGMSEEELFKETDERLKDMKRLLLEIRDALKTAGGIE